MRPGPMRAGSTGFLDSCIGLIIVKAITAPCREQPSTTAESSTPIRDARLIFHTIPSRPVDEVPAPGFEAAST